MAFADLGKKAQSQIIGAIIFFIVWIAVTIFLTLGAQMDLTTSGLIGLVVGIIVAGRGWLRVILNQ